MNRRSTMPMLALVFASLTTGCASDPPGAREFFDVRTDAATNDFDFEAWGREATLDLRSDLRGAALTELKIWVETADGRRAGAPDVRVASEPPIKYAAEAVGDAVVVRFDPPIVDATNVVLTVGAPTSVASPFRVRASSTVRR